jgi:hypothetical protein
MVHYYMLTQLFGLFETVKGRFSIGISVLGVQYGDTKGAQCYCLNRYITIQMGA